MVPNVLWKLTEGRFGVLHAEEAGWNRGARDGTNAVRLQLLRVSAQEATAFCIPMVRLWGERLDSSDGEGGDGATLGDGGGGPSEVQTAANMQLCHGIDQLRLLFVTGL